MITLKIENNKVVINGETYTVESHDRGIIDIEKAKETLEGDLHFVDVWFVKDCTGYVFFSPNPDRSKGHKDYCILKYRYNPIREKTDLVVMGYDRADMEKMSSQGAVVCHNCKTVIWSLDQHDYHYCRCLPKDADRVGADSDFTEEEMKEKRKQACAVDGGMDYMRSSPGSNCSYASINHLTKELTLNEEEGENNVG